MVEELSLRRVKGTRAMVKILSATRLVMTSLGMMQDVRGGMSVIKRKEELIQLTLSRNGETEFLFLCPRALVLKRLEQSILGRSKLSLCSSSIVE